jgi:hypothetical protein
MYEKKVTVWFTCADCGEQNRSQGKVSTENPVAFEQNTLDGLLTVICGNCLIPNFILVTHSDLEQFEQRGGG